MATSKARTLEDAYRVCDVKPLEASQLDYYVPFKARQDAVLSIHSLLRLQRPGDFDSFLFTGHVGCGKTSELNRIADHWQDQYLVVPLQVDEEIDASDLEYTDLYLVIIKQVEFALRQAGIRFDNDLLASFEDWFKDITQETEQTVERSVNVNAEASLGPEAPFLAKFLVKLMAQIKAGTKDKVTIRQTLAREVSRLRTDINLLLEDGAQKLCKQFPEKKGFLLILDGLDKCPPDVATRLFIDYAAQIKELCCTIIYTVPIAILYSRRKLGSIFENPHIMPMITVYQFNREATELAYDEDGLNQMANLIENRVEIDAVFAERDLLLTLAQMSGGHLRQMMRITRQALLTAIGRGHTRLEAADVTHAINQERSSFERTVSAYPNPYQELAHVAVKKELSDKDIGRDLLFSTAILEYEGSGSRWLYPNPVILDSEPFQRALTEYASSSDTSEPV
ncbi:AAA family ATPase [Oscillatoria sp. CS-180]|uniref:P-loop NTPase fold protein n=1 Tax=Oscillatoria sp. CS-180 TaxID=3021720 RepID=UPI00232FB6D1|nr:P-loop NTPase fold protein [Oscillatoria sp. CS-180]MDB9528320.1 AAA family ATPase [Oscillatoria sp. CS-180]